MQSKVGQDKLVEAVKWTSPEDHFKSCGGQSYSLWTNVSEFRKQKYIIKMIKSSGTRHQGETLLRKIQNFNWGGMN